MPGFSVKYPLSFNSVDGYYTMNKTLHDALKQNVKMLLLTIPGERVMDSYYGVGLSRFLFEIKDIGISSGIESEIRYQFERYLPQLVLIDVDVLTSNEAPGLSDEQLKVKVRYGIPSFQTTDEITVDL